MFIIIPSLKEISLQASKCQPVLSIVSSQSRKLCSLPWIYIMWKKISRSLNRLTGHGSKPNFILLYTGIFEKKSTEVSAFSYKCEFEWRSRSFTLVSNCTVYWCLSSHQVWKKFICKCLNTSQCLSFFQWNHVSWILSLINGDKMNIRLIRLAILNSTPNSIQIHFPHGEIIDTEFFSFLHPCNLESGKVKVI